MADGIYDTVSLSLPPSVAMGAHGFKLFGALWENAAFDSETWKWIWI